MALENLTGPNVFVTNLVASNPTPTDPLEQGDDHIRGVKNVLLNSFPNITAAMTRTAAQLNATVASDATPAAVAAAGAAGTSAAYSRSDHVHGGGAPVAGEVVQMVGYLDPGASTGSTALAGLTQSSKSFTPKFASSTVIVDVTFNASVPYVAANNAQGNFQIMRDGLGDSYIYPQVSASNAGGVGATNMGHVRYVYLPNNLSAVAHAFTLGGYCSNGATTISATNQQWVITEVKGT